MWFVGTTPGPPVTPPYPPATPPKPPRDCSEAFARGETTSGVYTVQPLDDGGPLNVYCDMDTDGGGWTVRLSSGVARHGQRGTMGEWGQRNGRLIHQLTELQFYLISLHLRL